ncbi:uncharacterized protein LOC142235916 [Haematobia irritans]|uniref:uncharacterized protein LOC142235916 n=1 Tax=Haematobia irritans TaxID=7368 RepID=UPI003F4FC7A8
MNEDKPARCLVNIKYVKEDKVTRLEDPKKYISVTYIPGFTERLKNSNIFDKEKFQLAEKTHRTVNELYSRTKSKLKTEEKSDVVYKIKCNGDELNTCNKIYVGTTKTKLKTRLSGHKSDVKAIDRPLEQKTALAAHCALPGHKPNLTQVDILAEERHHNKRFTLEMLHIIDVPSEKRLNYKTDIDGCSHIYREIVIKSRDRQRKLVSKVS